MFFNWFYQLGERNPQFFRELKGRLNRRNLGLTVSASFLLQALVFRADGGPMFDLPAYRDVLLLYSLARDLYQQSGVTAEDVDLLLPLGDEAVMESCTIATAHEAGWLWEIGLNGARGVGCVYSSSHISDERAAQLLRGYCGARDEDLAPRSIPFAPGYREQQWVKNCVAVGLAAGFLEPLEATGLVLVEAAVGMIAEMLPHSGPIHAPARRFNELMRARFENIINFLKLHYCLSQRTEPFWRDNADPATLPDRLAGLLEERFGFQVPPGFAWRCSAATTPSTRFATTPSPSCARWCWTSNRMPRAWR